MNLYQFVKNEREIMKFNLFEIDKYHLSNYRKRYSMLDLVDETAPPQSAVSLNHPRNVNCIGSVQILASRPIVKTNLSYLMLQYLFLILIC